MAGRCGARRRLDGVLTSLASIAEWIGASQSVLVHLLLTTLHSACEDVIVT